jgi:hypothetical protein
MGRVFAFLGIVSLMGLAGCASKGTLYGKVTYKGEPVGNATVSLTGAKPTDSFGGTTRADGTYEFGNIAPGSYKVTVITTPPPSKTGVGGVPVPQIQGVEQIKYVAIPAKYAQAETSGLSVTVGRGKQEYNPPLE